MKATIFTFLSFCLALSGGTLLLLAPAVYFTIGTAAELLCNPLAPTIFAVVGWCLFVAGFYFHHLAMVEYWGEDWDD